MKKLLVSLTVIAALGWIATTSQLPVRNWLLPKLEALAVRHADKLPLAYLGEKLFDKNCATCHDNPTTKAPGRTALNGFALETIMIAMEFGKMQPMAQHLSGNERRLIAYYLAGNDQQLYSWLDDFRCAEDSSTDAQVTAGSWGLDRQNRRYQPVASSGIDKANVGHLQLAWGLALPKVTDMRSQPAIIGERIYLGDKVGRLYALNRHSGCVYGSTKFISGIRSAITVADVNGKQALVFADSLATIYAVDAQTLETLWQSSVKLNPYSIVSGSISYHNGRLYVPLSSFEVAAAGSPQHICCTSHGGVTALSANDGSTLWTWHSTADAQLQGNNSAGQEIWGPSGASVWSTPTIDSARNLLYAGSGENLTHPATSTSDAIIALDLDSGEMRWHFQATANDVWNAACLSDGPNCPDSPGGDFDFGASVILTQNSEGKDILLAGQKSGEVFALDPDKGGEIIWRNRISQGTTNGGIHWGMAVSGNRLFVPVSDPEREQRPDYAPKPGLYALSIDDGSLLWESPAQRNCPFDYSKKPAIGLEINRRGLSQSLEEQYQCSYYYGHSAAATTTDEVAFSATLDGVIRAYSNSDGQVLWQTETAIPFDASNGVKGHGGAIDVAGQIVADGWLYVLSGYSLFGQLPGNMLLAYKVPKTESAQGDINQQAEQEVTAE